MTPASEAAAFSDGERLFAVPELWPCSRNSRLRNVLVYKVIVRPHVLDVAVTLHSACSCGTCSSLVFLVATDARKSFRANDVRHLVDGHPSCILKLDLVN